MASGENSLSDRYPNRASHWQIRDRRLSLPTRPLLMGIVNVTPDSFSDGAKFLDPAAAIDQALRLVDQGADLLDFGGESTRPYAEAVSEEEELRRVLPVIKSVVEQTEIPISIDTSKASVARAALDAGAQIINDVTGLEGDPDMISVARKSKAGICAMHMQGTPQTMQEDPTYLNVVEEIYQYLQSRRDKLLSDGIELERICLDPGIGFGKTHQHNLTLLAGCWRFHQLGCPVLVGHSRKGFMGKVLGDKQTDRTAATVGVSLSLAAQGVQILRVHDVEPVGQAMLLFEASGGIDGNPIDLC